MFYRSHSLIFIVSKTSGSEVMAVSESLYLPCYSGEDLTDETKRALVARLWPTGCLETSADRLDTEDFSAFFNVFRHECNPVNQASHAAQTFNDLLFLLDVVRDHLDSPIQDIRSTVQTMRPTLAADEKKLSASIELVVRVWLMTNFRNLMPTDRHILQNSIPWPDHQSLVGALQKHIIEPATMSRTVSMERHFPNHLNVDDLRKIGGFRIEWTDDLMYHLTLRGPTIYLFHHVSVLNRMRESIPSSVLPPMFIEETVATISLLIPPTRASCNRWLSAEIQSRGLDRNLMYRTSALKTIKEYPFWGERLDVISEALNSSKPKNLFQWWHDRRDMKEWWGFWLVVAGIFLTVLFGLIQSVTGIIQVTRQ